MIIKLLKLFVLLVASYALVGALLHHWVFPEPTPDPSNYPRAGDKIVNRFSGERLVFLRTGPETEGRYTENEIRLQPGGAVPKAHVHLKQEETFNVISGQLTLVENGQTFVLGPGQSHTVAMGVPHQPFNKGDVPLVARVRITPAGRADLMLTQVHGFLTEKDTPRTERDWFLQAMMYCVYYDTYLAKPSVAAQKVLSFLIVPTARMLGYQSWYPAYATKWQSS